MKPGEIGRTKAEATPHGTVSSLAKWNDYFPNVRRTDWVRTWDYHSVSSFQEELGNYIYLRVKRNL